MKTLAAAVVIVGGLATWIPAAGAQEHSPDISGRSRSARTQAYPRNNSGTDVRDHGEPAVPREDQSKAQSALPTAEENRKTIMADDARATSAHNGKVISANFQAVYDRMSDAQKKTVGGVFRNHISAAEVTR